MGMLFTLHWSRQTEITRCAKWKRTDFAALRQWELQTPDSKCCRIANSAERGSQNLLFFNVHLELFKNADAFFDVRVSAE